MNKPLTITFFGLAPLTYGGGYETYILKTIEKLCQRGHIINVVTGDQNINDIIFLLLFHKYLEKRIVRDDIQKRLPYIKIYEYGFTSLMPTSKSFRDIREIMKNSDIIYTRNEITDFLFINHFCGKYQPPIVCGIHTSIIYPHTKSLISMLHNLIYCARIYGKLLDNCSIILTQNHFDTELLVSIWGIKETKVIKLLPFVDTDFFCVKNISRTYDKFNILFAGRLTEQKGIDILCKSIEYISKLPEFNDMTFTIAGSGELDYMIKELGRKYDNIKFLGFVSDKILVELYNSHDVVVLPSRWETALKVVLEAQASGLPVIVSDIPGPNELIIPEKTGFLTKPEDYKFLAENMLKMFRLKMYHSEDYVKMRYMCIKNSEKYAVDAIIKKLENIFYDLYGR